MISAFVSVVATFLFVVSFLARLVRGASRNGWSCDWSDIGCYPPCRHHGDGRFREPSTFNWASTFAGATAISGCGCSSSHRSSVVWLLVWHSVQVCLTRSTKTKNQFEIKERRRIIRRRFVFDVSAKLFCFAARVT